MAILLLLHGISLAQEENYPTNEEILMAKRFIDAEKELQLGNYTEALALYEQCLSFDPKNDAVYFGRGKVHMEQEQYALAETAFKQAYDLDPDNKWYALSYAQMLIEQLKFKEASKVYKIVSERYPSDSQLKLDYANTLLFAGKSRAAMKVYEELEEEVGPSHEITQRKYEYFIGEQRYNDAAEELKKLIKVYPEDTQLYGMLAELYKAQGKIDEAIEVYEEAYAAEPNNPIFQLSLAEYYDRDGRVDTAFHFLRMAFGNPNLDIDRKVGVLLRMYQQAETDEDARNKVLTLCREVISTHPEEAKAFSVYGDFLNLDGQRRAALKQFKKAVELDPSRFAIWSQILLIENELGMIKELAHDSKRALELFPAQPTVYFFNGIANSQLEEWKQAAKSLKAGSQMVIGNAALSAQMLASLGDAYHELGRPQSSDSAFEAALAFEPNNAYVLNNYSYFLSLRGEKLEKAKEMSARSLEAEPTNASYLDTYGWILYQLEDFEGAKKYLEDALKNGGDSSPEVLEHHGDTLYQLGMKNEAVEQWDRAFTLDSSNERLNEKVNTGRLNE